MWPCPPTGRDNSKARTPGKEGLLAVGGNLRLGMESLTLQTQDTNGARLIRIHFCNVRVAASKRPRSGCELVSIRDEFFYRYHYTPIKLEGAYPIMCCRCNTRVRKADQGRDLNQFESRRANRSHHSTQCVGKGGSGDSIKTAMAQLLTLRQWIRPSTAERVS
jgi:hypothetical protein